jgi:hypothetical protein
MALDIQRTLLLQCRSVTDEEIALHESVSLATVRRRADSGMSDIFDTLPVAVRRNAKSAGYWVACHQECCMRDATQSIDGDMAAGG